MEMIITMNWMALRLNYHTNLLLWWSVLASEVQQKLQFWGQNDIQTPNTSTSPTECLLQLYFNFSKSVCACNVRLCFDFYLNVTLCVLFSVALKQWGRGGTLETAVFLCSFFTRFNKLCKNHNTKNKKLPTTQKIIGNWVFENTKQCKDLPNDHQTIASYCPMADAHSNL